MGNSSETQQKIIDAAILIFASQGYHGTTTAEIAREAQVAEGTIFKYYKTKKQLLRAVLGYIIHEVVPSVMSAQFQEQLINLGSGDAKSTVKTLLLSKIEQISKNVNCIKIVVNEIQYHEDLKQEYLGQLVPGFIKFMEGIYEKGVKNGVFRDINSHTAVRSFVGMISFLVLEKNVLNKQLDISKELDTILDIYINGVVEKRENNA